MCLRTGRCAPRTPRTPRRVRSLHPAHPAHLAHPAACLHLAHPAPLAPLAPRAPRASFETLRPGFARSGSSRTPLGLPLFRMCTGAVSLILNPGSLVTRLLFQVPEHLFKILELSEAEHLASLKKNIPDPIQNNPHLQPNSPDPPQLFSTLPEVAFGSRATSSVTDVLTCLRFPRSSVTSLLQTGSERKMLTAPPDLKASKLVCDILPLLQSICVASSRG